LSIVIFTFIKCRWEDRRFYTEWYNTTKITRTIHFFNKFF
jgi:hypothetical protein